MTNDLDLLLLAPNGETLAEILVTDEEEGWLTGRVTVQRFPVELRRALAWYDEVVRDQMLSYVDEAMAAVQRFELQVKYPDGSTYKTYALHVSDTHEVSFRISPVLPPPEWAQTLEPNPTT